MNPLEALGLERDADERAVKRAYAQRLRKTRPDEDPAGFQALHETYQAALGYLRWRAENPDEPDWDEDWEDEDDAETPEAQATPGAQAAPADAASTEAAAPEPPADIIRPILSEEDFAALIGNPRYVAKAPERPPAEERPPADEAPAGPRLEAFPERPEPFRLDFDDFAARLFTQATESDRSGLLHWLEREIANWPISLKGAVAPRLLDHLSWEDEEDLPFTPGQLDVLIELFGLDDVLAGVDPIAVQELRNRVESSTNRRYRRALLGHLWQPENVDELARYMHQPEQGRHRVFVTRVVASLLTRPDAYRWAWALRPVPFLNAAVMRFLRDADRGRLDILRDVVDEKALDFWEWAETRREKNRTFRYLVVIGFLLFSLGYFGESKKTVPAPRETVLRDARETAQIERFRRAFDLAKTDAAAGLAEYDALIAEIEQPYTRATAQLVSLAYFNRAAALRQLARPQEAMLSYGRLADLFAGSPWPEVQLNAGKGLVNLGIMQFAAGAHAASEETYRRAFTVLSTSPNREGFPLQLALAYLGHGRALDALGRRDEASAAFQSAERVIADRTGDDFDRLRNTLAELRQARGEPEPARPADPG